MDNEGTVKQWEQICKEKDNQINELIEEKEKFERWWKEANQKRGEYLKYKNAFQCLIKEFIQ